MGIILKKSTGAICSSGNVQSVAFLMPASITSPLPPTSPPRRRSAPVRQRWPQFRLHGTVGHDNHRQKPASGSSGPSCPWPTSPNPTPYEILQLKRGAPYTKTRFYELVKIYHPDTSNRASHDGMAHAARLERYRLVVTANDILGDPVKRRAYDLYGAGWDVPRGLPKNTHGNRQRSWRHEPGSAANNATWEDWERWYQERDGVKPEPRYMSNPAFVGIILFFVMIGGWGQATRVGRNSASLVEMRDQSQKTISRDFRQRQTDSAPLTREARVESFLRQREGWECGMGHVTPSK